MTEGTPQHLTASGDPSATAQAIITTLRGFRFRLDNEKRLQEQVFGKLVEAGFPAEREVKLAQGDVIDFMVGSVGIEAKIKGQRLAIYRQCERYCGHDAIGALVVITNAAMGFPAEIGGKPVFVLSLGQGWF